MLTNLHAWPLERLDCGLIKGMARRPTFAKTTKTNAGCAADRVQLATYPQSPFPGPVRCCAFSQRTGPGRLWISLGAVLSFVLMHCGAAPGKHPQKPALRFLSRIPREKTRIPIIAVQRLQRGKQKGFETPHSRSKQP